MRQRRGPEETALDTWVEEQGPYLKLEVRSPKLEVRSPKLEVRSPKVEVRSPKLEVRGSK